MTATCTNTACTPNKSTPYSIASTFRLVVGMFETRSQRRALTLLDSARLEDLGLSFEDATSEAKSPFWDVPAHWKL